MTERQSRSASTVTPDGFGQCRDCQWWYDYGVGALGQCRLHAPTGLQPADGRSRAWPEVYAHDACGEFVLKVYR